jgi:CBS domain-containing protein
MTAGEICNREVCITPPDTPVVDAAREMKRRHVGDLVVVREGDGDRVPIGILTDRDIAMCTDRLVERPHMKVFDVMSVELVTAAESEDLHDVLRKMQSHGIRRLPIVNERGGLEGILTLDDVIELLSEELTELVKLVAAEQNRERLGMPGGSYVSRGR